MNKTTKNPRLVPGAELVATYKKQEYRCQVIGTPEEMKFQLEDGRAFGSLSGAGRAVTGRSTCEGTKFWSIASDAKEGATPEPTTSEVPTKKPKATAKAKAVATKMVRVIKKIPNQKNVPEGQTKFHCSACMESFLSESTDPKECPKGHSKESADELSTGKEADATE